MSMSLAPGPLMIGVTGYELTDEERERLCRPQIGGVILFTRNYASREQLMLLTRSIKALRSPALLVGVDHEGGRVQRLRDGFTAIPAMRELGNLWDRDRPQARVMARDAGYVIACELIAHGIDFAFGPVLDIDHGNSSVIGDRAFHNLAGAVAALACALQSGLRAGGMNTVGKHFPGHGFAHADSHSEVPVDERPLALLEANDLEPFKRMAAEGMGAVMPAHVIYPAVDSRPAGFSRIWLQDILRGRLGFEGAIISDDLGMAGASTAGGMVERAQAALDAGCDMILSCNDEAAAQRLIDNLPDRASEQSPARLIALAGRSTEPFGSAAYLAARDSVIQFSGQVTHQPILPDDIVARL
jgi:beta-N-acetylhexosaminidase